MKKGERSPAKIKFWRKHIKRWESSGLLQKDYCAKRGLHPATFGLWKRILAKLASGQPSTAVDIRDGQQPAQLIPLSVVPEPDGHVLQPLGPARAGIQLHAGGYTIDLAVGFDASTLRTLLETLGS